MDFDVDKLAKLSMLDLSDEERAKFSTELPSIMAYVGKLAEVDTSKVSARDYLSDLNNVFRADEPQTATEAVHAACIEAFPVKAGGALEVPGVFE
jgi:aspartyl-tRNA(Asn)/glutamyl-tRNA(Gln) amidotransferase subunit C